jgi:hypothetical protein
MDHTHDPSRRSWVESANGPATDFPIQNLPFGVFRRRGRLSARVGVAIGDQILDVSGCQQAGLLAGEAEAAGRACLPLCAAFVAAALNRFMAPACARPEEDPKPLAYLDSPANRERGGVDLRLEVGLRTPAMRGRGEQPAWLTRSRFASMGWTFAQMLTHQASNGCNLRAGDLLASGTVSGSADTERGCLLELTRGGAKSITLPGGETRTFLEDGDEVIFRGFCERPGFARIGFGECRGQITAA